MMNDIQRRILAEAAKYGGANISVPDQMAAMVNEANANPTFAQDIKKMMTVWNGIMAKARKQFPNASEEELYRIAKGAMDHALSSSNMKKEEVEGGELTEVWKRMGSGAWRKSGPEFDREIDADAWMKSKGFKFLTTDDDGNPIYAKGRSRAYIASDSLGGWQVMVKEEVEVSEAEDYKTSEGTPKVIGKYTFTPFVEGSVSGWRINVKGFSKEVGFVDKPLGRNTKTSVAPNRVYFHSVPGYPDLKAFAYPSTETRVLSQREFRFAPRQLLKAVAMWMDAYGYRMVGEGLESVDFHEGREWNIKHGTSMKDVVDEMGRSGWKPVDKMPSGNFSGSISFKKGQSKAHLVVKGGNPEKWVYESVEEDQETVSEYRRPWDHSRAWSGGRSGYRSTSYSGDPRWITAKYAGRDANGKPFKAGEKVLYFPNGKKFYTGAEAEKAWLEFLSAKGDEEGMPFAH